MAATTRDLLLELVPLHVRGRTLDLGAGSAKYRELFKAHASSYETFDADPRPGIDTVGDIHALPYADATFDTVVSTQVLEHVTEPWRAAEETARILKPGGKCIFTMPFLIQYHAHPDDYYRYTIQGGTHLCTRVGLEIVETRAIGGFCTVLAEMIRFSIASPYHKPGKVRRILIEWIHRFLTSIDRVPANATLYANTCIIARKPA